MKLKKNVKGPLKVAQFPKEYRPGSLLELGQKVFFQIRASWREWKIANGILKVTGNPQRGVKYNVHAAKCFTAGNRSER